jgi:hypothetical protein
VKEGDADAVPQGEALGGALAEGAPLPLCETLTVADPEDAPLPVCETLSVADPEGDKAFDKEELPTQPSALQFMARVP